MGGGKAPKPPDYAAAAEATAAGDKEAARYATYANRINQYNPWGSIEYESYLGTDPETGEPVTQWNQYMNLDPEAQAALDSQIGVQKGRSELAEGMLGDIGQDYGTRMDWDQFGNPIGMDPMQRMGGAGEGIQNQLGDMTTSAGLVEGSKMNLYGLPQYQRQALQQDVGFDDPGLQGQNLEQNIDYSGASGVDAPEWTREAAEQSVYERGAARLDPQFAQEEEALRVQLANQGLSPGDQAYDDQMKNFQDRKTDAYANLQAQSRQEGARQAESMFGMQKERREMMTGEEDRMKDFRNRALEGQFGIDAQRQAQLYDIAESQGMFTNQARLGQMGADLAARMGEGDLRATQAQIGNQYAQLMAQQNQFNAGLGNQALMAQAQFGNQAQQQAWNQMQQQLGYNQNLGFRENALANQLRTQGMNEAMQQRAYRLNELNALLSGQQVQAPGFNSFAQQGQTRGPDMLGAAGTQYEADMAKYGADQAMMNSLMGGLGMAGSMFMGMPSDRRLKKNIQKIGQINGVNWYEYDYIWDEHAIGVMADEVPWAAFETPSGYLMVDYRRV